MEKGGGRGETTHKVSVVLFGKNLASSWSTFGATVASELKKSTAMGILPF
jgi:hypothetical protein